MIRHQGPFLSLRQFQLFSKSKNFLITIGAKLIVVRLQISHYLFVGAARRHQLLRVGFQDAVLALLINLGIMRFKVSQK